MRLGKNKADLETMEKDKMLKRLQDLENYGSDSS